MSSLPAAHEIAAAVRSGDLSAEAVTRTALSQIERMDPALRCFTSIHADRALGDARSLDARIRRGESAGPLAGVPFGVKDLYDVAGTVTLAGSRILRDNPAATTDAVLVQRLRAAGAILVGCQNMDEFAYGFTTENAHYGATRNPHDHARSAGGSSGGSAAAVAAGFVALSLGSDTNGSIRVPASFCGVFGLKPTYGRLPRTGTFPFVHDLDHLGPFARSVTDLAVAYDVMQGHDGGDPACARRANEPSIPDLRQDAAGLRAGVLDDWFERAVSEDAREVTLRVAQTLGPIRRVRLPEAGRARAAAFCLTSASGAALHRERLRARPQDFDPATRDRFYAGSLLPAVVLAQAQRLRRWFLERALELFAQVDVLLAPATPDVAPLLGQKTMTLDGREVPLRPNIGVCTQPISFIGLPVVSVPVWPARGLPIGVQVIAPPWRESLALRVAAHLESRGVVGCAPTE